MFTLLPTNKLYGTGSGCHNCNACARLRNSNYLSKIIASRKLGFSNSPIEAINKIIKRYLRVHRPENEGQLRQCIKHSVYDYTEVRPYGSLDNMIPMEVYRLQPPKQDLSKAFSAAKAQRIAYNSASGCKVCS